MTTHVYPPGPGQNGQPLKAVDGAIVSTDFLEQARRKREYPALLGARRLFSKPCAASIEGVDGLVDLVGYTTTQPPMVFVKAGDGGTPIPVEVSKVARPELAPSAPGAAA